MRHLIPLLLLLLTSLLHAADTQPPLSTLRDRATLATWSTLPVQEDGRVKPLDTIARYRLLRFHGARVIRFVNPETQVKEKFSAIEWLLISWFRPDIAKTMPVFRVDFDQAMNEIGVDTSKKERFDKYSYAEIEPHRKELMEKMSSYSKIEAKKRKPEQRMLVNLGMNFLDYEMILTHWDFARKPLGDDAQNLLPPELATQLPQPLRISTAIQPVMAYLAANPAAGAPMANPWLMNLMRNALSAMMSGNQEQSMRIFPPENAAAEQWSGPGTILMEALNGQPPTAAQMQWLQSYEGIYHSAHDPAAFQTAVKTFSENVRKADSAGATKYVNLEASYHQADYFYYALQLFVLGLLTLGLGLIKKGSLWSRIMGKITWAVFWVATLLALTGITIRCIIMQRPPITTLYETILFIATSGAIFGLLAELLTRKRWGLLLCAISGVAGFYLAIRFEDMEHTDTIQQLQAVLITNFWLATHVPCINLGYAAAMVAAILSMVYFMGCSLKLIQKEGAKDLSRMVYGFICAGLFLSLIGTILGGIWANDSWGRFWGWDPKENGALMIVLMCLITLHARLGGYVREIGLHVCSIILGCVTVFSWFGVNQLGVGLHAYGFTDGVWGKLALYWASQLVILLLALWLKIRPEKTLLKSEKSSPPPLHI